MTTSTIDVLARANLTLQGQLLTVGQITTLVDDAEVEACIAQQLLVARDAETGGFPDLGPLNGRVASPGWGGCRSCGG